MRRWLVTALIVMTVVGAPLVARAATRFFNFTWETVASWFRTTPDLVFHSASGSISGSGLLALTDTPTGFTFGFAGPGGSGHGGSLSGGAGIFLDYPWPPGVPDVRPGNRVSQGTLVDHGTDIVVTFVDASHSNTFGDNLDAQFSGVGELAATAEPATLLVLGVGLLVAGALVRAARRPRIR